MDTYERVYRTIDRLAEAMPDRVGHDFATWGEVFDAPTVMTLHRYLRGNVLRSLDYPISTGKEANVFKATSGDGDPVVVKVYRVHTATFRHMLPYIDGDPRFRKVPRGHRQLIHAWAKKEYRNLERFREAGVDVPIPFKSLHNTVVMEYLGTETQPAPTMKTSPPADPDRAMAKLWDDYKRALRHSRTIHADVSEYNVLMVEDRPRLIDVAQGVLDTHPMAVEFMERDIHNLSRYFGRQGADVDEAALLAEAKEIHAKNQDRTLDEEEI